jgi:anaerobic selenocysteine-containing dehydrogenase
MASTRQTIRTYCPMSKSRCGVIATVENGKFVGLAPDPDHPNRGICVKGESAPQMVYDPLRLKYPMRRTRPKFEDDPGWKRVGWDEAMSEIADRLQALKAAHGPESVFFYRGAAGGSSSQEYEAFMIRFASVFGSPNTVSTGHICNWHKDTGSLYTYGSGISAPDFENTTCILLWGHNPQASWPTQAIRISRAVNRGARLIIIDPRPIPLTKKAALWLPVRPGSDGLLAMSFLHVMLEEKLYNADFLRRWTNGGLMIAEAGDALRGEALVAGAAPGQFVVWNENTGQATLYDPEMLGDGESALTGRYRVGLADGREVAARPAFELLRERVQHYAPEKTATRTGIAPDLVRRCVRLFTTTTPNCYYTYNGIEQHADSMQINRAVCLFYALTGNLDRRGGNVRFPKPPTNDVEGRKLLSPEQFNKRLGYSARPLGPTHTGKVQAYEVYKAILTGKPYPVRGFLSFGGDIILSNGDTDTGRRALQALDLYVQTEFYETPPARYADFLLPAATPWESWNLRTSFEQGAETSAHMQYRAQVVQPQHESRPDLEVIFDLAVRMGFGEQFWNGSIEKAFDYVLAPSGVTLAELKRHPGGMTVPLEVKYQKYLKSGFKTPSRRVEIYSLTFEQHGYDPLPGMRMPEEIFGSDIVARYPYTLTTAKSVAYCHGQHRSVPSLRRKIPEPFGEINPRDGESCGIHEGDMMRVETKTAAITVKAAFNAELPEKIVRVMHGWWQGCPQLDLPAYDPFSAAGANVNLILKNDIIDPITGSVPQRSYPCRIARVDKSAVAVSAG